MLVRTLIAIVSIAASASVASAQHASYSQGIASGQTGARLAWGPARTETESQLDASNSTEREGGASLFQIVPDEPNSLTENPITPVSHSTTSGLTDSSAAAPFTTQRPRLAQVTAPNVQFDPYYAQPNYTVQPGAAEAISLPPTTGVSPLFNLNGVGAKAGVGYLGGKDVGLDDGFLWMQGFIPLVQTPNQSLLFADIRGLSYNDGSGQYGVNAALGYRVVNPSTHRVFGFYGGYDFRHFDPQNFGQISGGVESLGTVWDVRANGYWVVDGSSNSVTGVTSEFSGNQILQTASLIRGLSGFDAEAGANLTAGDPTFDLRMFGGFYGFFDDSSSDIWGVRGRVEGRWNNWLTVEGSVQNDNVFNTTAFVAISVLIGGCNQQPACGVVVADRLGDPLQKNMHVVVRERTVRDRVAINPLTGNPYSVLHIDSRATAGGTGTYEDPFDTLAEGEAPADIVLVHAGSEFNGEEITLNFANQRFLGDGDGVTHTFASQYGTNALPEANALNAQPVILNAPTDAITIAASGVEVSGFVIDTPTNNGIVGTGLSGFNINNNSINRAIDGVSLTGSNSGSLTNNSATDNADDGFDIATFTGGTISGNGAVDNGDQGFEFGTVSGGTISGNTARSNLDAGFTVSSFSGGTISGNTAETNVDGYRITTLSGGTFTGNMANSNTDNGVEIATMALGTVSNNSATGNTTNGFFVDTFSGGTMSGNTATMNTVAGFQVGTSFDAGTISGNTATTNGDGFLITALNGGTLSGNTAQTNTQDGFVLADFSSGTVSDNFALTNMDDGFDIGDTQWIGGALNNNTDFGYEVTNRGGTSSASGNTATGNGDNTLPAP